MSAILLPCGWFLTGVFFALCAIFDGFRTEISKARGEPRITPIACALIVVMAAAQHVFTS